MKKTALRLSTLAFGLALTGMIAPSGFAVEATTDPVGYYTLPIIAATDNVMSLPMVRDAVFAGAVDGTTAPTATTFKAKAGTASPGWTVNQFQYIPTAAGNPASGMTYYVEFTGSPTDVAPVNTLRGLFYRIVSNTADTLTLDTEGDSLLSHALPTAAGGTVNAAIASGDSFKIRPFWRLRDVLQNGSTPIIEPRPDEFNVRDDVLFPNYSTVGINKAPSQVFYYLAGATGGWRQVGGDPEEDRGDRIMQPNEAFIVRRKNATATAITNLGGVQMSRSITFVAGGTATSGNDIYISINRPAAVTLNDSGLHNDNQTLSLIKDSASIDVVNGDQLLAFATGTGFNRPPTRAFFFVGGQPAGQGWREVSNEEDVTTGATFKLEPGRVYIVRKKANNPGRDWVNEPNY